MVKVSILCRLALVGLLCAACAGAPPQPAVEVTPVTPTALAVPQQAAAAPTAAPTITALVPAPTELPTAAVLAPTMPGVQPTSAAGGSMEAALPSPTPVGSTSEQNAAARGPVIGGADGIAYLSGGEIWAAGLDGSGLHQLTSDGAEKSNLQWDVGGQAVLYLQGECLSSAGLEGAGVEDVLCLDNIETFSAFEVSPDGSQLALSVNNQLYLVPYDRERLRQVSRLQDLASLAGCQHFAPYQAAFVKSMRWSRDGRSLALFIMAMPSFVRVYDVSQCTPQPRLLAGITEKRFQVDHNKSALMIDFAWDGARWFAMNTVERNLWYGDLQLMDYPFMQDVNQLKLQARANPLGGRCCYSAARFSPDGSYLLFAFQDMAQGAGAQTHLYYIPLETLGSGGEYAALPLPPITDPRANPRPVLRRIP